MGNQLVGIAPSQIFPVEHYLREHAELKFDGSLGSTRFLKVARAHSQEGLIVCKVFAIHDPTLPLSPHRERLEDLRNILTDAANCLPFQRIVVNDKAAILMREYVKFSLYDRISTRPFLTNIEKRWITFQVLYALHQCHNVGICHGDIKLENIMITSWNWVLLVDFASFKPTFLPEDNPADYSYFFDTSRRRTCYIAPERFTKSVHQDTNPMFYENTYNCADLTPAMDIFSAGCALMELWNEGHAPFDLSQLLAYRNSEYTPIKHLDNIKDLSLKSLLSSMIQRDPVHRKTADVYLSEERGRLFPAYFYTFLQSYMQIFSGSRILSPDEKITHLKKDIVNVSNLLSPKNKEDSESVTNDNDGLVIVVSLVTSCIRGLHDSSSKIKSLEILYELSCYANEETILDRILPYILHLAADPTSRVKVAAINTVTKCLQRVRVIPRTDANIFPEYILPGLKPLASDQATCVRAAYAKNIATLAENALRFLNQTMSGDNTREVENGSGEDDDFNSSDNTGSSSTPSKLNYEMELQALHDMVQQTVSSLLTDQQSIVKQTLVDSGITKLCVFFGKQKANDILLSHMITFLNDKESRELRAVFFDCIVGVAAYSGWYCTKILAPLLLQGLTDESEFVAMKAIHAMSALTELGLLTKPSICELIADTCSFLVHPNLWIRQAVAGFVSAVAKTLTLLDVQCKIVPYLEPFMSYPVIQIEKPELLLEALMPPIQRTIFDSVVKNPDVTLLFEQLESRKRTRDLITTGRSRIDYVIESNQNIHKLIRRLEASGMDDTVENHLLSMKTKIIKMHKYRLMYETKLPKPGDGRIEINSLRSTVRGHAYTLGDVRAKQDFSIQTKQSESTSSGGPPSSSRSTSSRPSSPTTEPSTLAFTITGNELPNNISLHERSYIQYRTANCKMELGTLINRQQENYLEAIRSREWAEQAAWRPQLPPPGWRLRGSLVAHLHEHRGPVTKLISLADSQASMSTYFASASLDGYVRLWDCARIEGKNITNRSKMHYRLPNDDRVVGLSMCEVGGDTSLALASFNGTIQLLNIDHGSSKLLLKQTLNIPEEDGCALDVQYLDSGPMSMLVYATLYGAIVGWDPRAPTVAWRLENGLRQGVITTFCMDSHRSWITLGTSSGSHISWDLRFQLQIASFDHPQSYRIRKIVHHPTEHSQIISSAQGFHNELTVWNIETGCKQKVLWGSKTPPLSSSKRHSQPHVVSALQAGCIDRSGYVLAGGTDKQVRLWDLENPRQSYIAIPARSDNQPITTCYDNRVIDGIPVIYEVVDPSCDSRQGKDKSEELPRAGPEPPTANHRDCISDIALCKASQCYLLTASRDGVIKMWK